MMITGTNGDDSAEEKQYSQRELMPPAQLQREFQEALAAAGYADRETIVELVRSVKKEMAEERYEQVYPSGE